MTFLKGVERRGGLVAALVALLGGCGSTAPGDMSDPGKPASPVPSAGDPGAPPAGSGPTTGLLEARVWRLTRTQYDNTVHDLLGDTSTPGRKFLSEEGGTGFRNAELTLGFKDTNMAEFSRTALRLAAETVASPERLASVFPCGEARLADEGCSKEFVTKFGRRAFRRPLTSDEVARYQGIYDQGKKTLGARAGVQLVIEAMLQSPLFLFRVEAGDGKATDHRVRLTAHEVAAQLSYYLWNAPPDAELDAAADDGALLDPKVLEAQARRLLDHDRARPVVFDLFSQMMGYDALDDMSKTGAFATPFNNVKKDLAGETSRFLAAVLWSDQPTLGRLLTAPFTVANGAIGAVYGGNGMGADWKPLDLPPAERAGLLTQPGLMAVTAHEGQTSPVLRGKFIAERILCSEVPDPPPNVNASEPKANVAKTTRQRYEQHATDAACAACHRLMDGIGYAFEHLDPVGRTRQMENGVPVDTSGALVGSDKDGPFANVKELAARLADSQQVRACFAQQLYRFASGRKETPEEAPATDELVARFGKAQWNVKELLLAYVLSERFGLRRVD